VSDPFFITGPALISFSGGRTSGYMLWRILQAHGGALPDDVHVCFANTGKEREETLRFVHECASRWNVRVRWLEFTHYGKRKGALGRFEEVGFNSASRNGEPFQRLINLKKSVPTQRHRWCTEFLKVKTMFDFAESVGLPRGSYTEVIGLRADEGHRIKRMREDARNEARTLAFPLSSADVRRDDIYEFWRASDFDLNLPRDLGNCDHCPMIGIDARIRRAQIDPAGTEQWAKWEISTGYRFGKYLSFVEVLGFAASSPQIALPETDYDTECGSWCPGEAA
jgi:3'-phosphoadenosine 5'-phosphosulfate sulfotransferase (PAPS reductase)/FAD synthetase